MVCPVCGTPLSEGMTTCPQCGSTITTTPMPTTPMATDPTAMNNQMPMNQVPMDINQGISVPKDFKLAGGNGDNGNNMEELPDGIANLLGMNEEEKAPVPKKKKRRRKLIKTIIFMVIGVIGLAIAILFILGLTPETVTYDLVCTRTVSTNGMKTEFEYKFSDQGGFFNSDNKMVISNENGSDLTLEDKASIEKEMGTLGFDQTVELSNGKIIVTYSNSHYNVATVDQVRSEVEKSGAKCK